MGIFCKRLARTAVVSIAATLAWQEAEAQSTTSSASSATTTAGTSSTWGAGSGIPSMTAALPLVLPSPVSIVGSGTTPMGTAQQANIFSNPYAAPLLQSTMGPLMQAPTQSGLSTTQTQAQSGTAAGQMGMTTDRLALWMLANQQAQGGGIGSGQLSGVRPRSGVNPQQARTRTSAQTNNVNPRVRSQPAGLAGRYFNRTTPSTPYPKSHYNRQSSYYP